ncbi:MAG: hypothetical protein ACKORL_04075, partial [Phycisphaerales bacterium]
RAARAAPRRALRTQPLQRHPRHANRHPATVTYCDADYLGSITLDRPSVSQSVMKLRPLGSPVSPPRAMT